MIEKNIYLYSTLEDYILIFNIFRQLIKRKKNKKILINHNRKTFLKNIYKLFTIQLSQICNFYEST